MQGTTRLWKIAWLPMWHEGLEFVAADSFHATRSHPDSDSEPEEFQQLVFLVGGAKYSVRYEIA